MKEIWNGRTNTTTRKHMSETQCRLEFWKIGQAYFIRTVTYHYTGVLVVIDEKELVLAKAAWIADSGRFMQAMETGSFSEVEPYPKDRHLLINRSAIVDAVEIVTLPTEQK
jgi:hypothetical protein